MERLDRAGASVPGLEGGVPSWYRTDADGEVTTDWQGYRLGEAYARDGGDRMNVVVTGGGTVAPIDDVRTITNSSSGRFSAALTEALLRQGARVWHVHAPKAVLPFRRSAGFDLDVSAEHVAAEHARLDRLREDYGSVRHRLHLVPVALGTVDDYAATLERVLRTEAVDVAILAMAVSDYEPDPVAGKIDSGGESLLIQCRKTPKVIRSVRDWSPGVFLVGFKLLAGATTEELVRRAEQSRRESRADVTIANDQRTLREGRHTVHLVRPEHPAETFEPGEGMAVQVVGRILELARAAKGRIRHGDDGPERTGAPTLS